MPKRSSSNLRSALAPLVPIKRLRGDAPEPLSLHAALEIQYVKLGEGVYTIAGSNFPFRRQSVLIIPPHTPHHAAAPTAETVRTPVPHAKMPLEKAVLLIAPALIRRRFRAMRVFFFHRHLCLSEREAADMEIMIRKMEEEQAEQAEGWRATVTGALQIILIMLKRADRRPPVANAVHPKIAAVQNYLETHFAEDVAIACLARLVFVSESWLSHLFKAQTGMGIKQFLLQRRIAEAKRIIDRDPAVKVTYIAEQVGFRDFALFNRSFKKFTGLNPSAYRRISHQDNRN